MRDDIAINENAKKLENQLNDTLEIMYDPDVERDIDNLGLRYAMKLDENGHMEVVMTFTDTACECAETVPIEIVDKLKKIEGIETVSVTVTWTPAWKITRISRFSRIALGISPRSTKGSENPIESFFVIIRKTSSCHLY